MRILKNGQNQTWLTIQAVDGALYSVYEDEPVFLTIRTNQEITSVRNNLSNFELEYLGVSIPLQLVDIEIVYSLNLLSGGGLHTYRLLCKKSNTDFTPKSYYKQQYNTLYQQLTGQLQTVEYTVTNLLGAYGSFSTDSNGDGIADGWIRTGTVGTYSLAEGKQRYTVPSGNLGTMQGIQIELTIPAEERYLYFRTNYESYSSHQNEDGIRILQADIWGGSNPQWGVYPLRVPSQAQINNGLYSFCIKKLSGNIGMDVYPFLVRSNNYTQESYVVVSKTMVVDLTAMGELPEKLKEFFFNSVSSWQDLGIRAYALLPSKQKDNSGNYIVRTGLEWLNYLIDYVDSTGVVTKTLKF